MSPFWVYVILKLDAVGCLFGVTGGIVLTIALAFIFVQVATWSDYGCCESDRPKVKRQITRVALPVSCVGLLAIAVAVALPTTKQAAAIWLLPRIATEENIDAATNEAREVYSLAKQWLREQVETPQVEADNE